MERGMWTRKRQILAGGCAGLLLLAGVFSGMGLKKLLPAGEAPVPVYSVEGLRDKKWSDAVSIPAAVEAGSLTAYYYDSRKPAAELYVKEGQRVEVGTALLRYDCTALAEELSGVERSLANQRVYLERLGGFIGILRATKPRPDGLGRNPEGAGGGLALVSAGERTDGGPVVSLAGNGVFLPVSSGSLIAPSSAEESLEGFVEAEGQDGAPVVYDRVDGSAVPSGGTGTAQDPYVYYVKKGGQVAPEVLAMLARMKLSGRFVVVEDEKGIQAPLLVWDFDGKVYEEVIQGPSESSEESSQTGESSSGQEESSTEVPEPEESTPGGSSTEESGPEESTPEESGTETSGTDRPGESSASQEESSSDSGEEMPPDFGGAFDDDALNDALGGLESAPQGYTKEELAQAIRERSLEYENLGLAIQKNELQAEKLRREMEENVLTAETDGLVRTAMDPKEAARLGQPVLTVQGRGGSLLGGQMNEVLAAVLHPGDRLQVSARVRGKPVSFEAVLQSVEREPGGGAGAALLGESGISGGMPGENGGVSGLAGGEMNGLPSGESTGNPAMSHYRFAASVAEGTGIRAGDTVEILIPRTVLGQSPEGDGSPVENKSPAESKSPAVEGSVILPDALLFYEGGSAFVYAMGEDGRLIRRQVETGRSFEGTKTEILSGLTGEDYLAYPEEAAGKEGAKARIVYGEEMEIGTEESEAWEETES